MPAFGAKGVSKGVDYVDCAFGKGKLTVTAKNSEDAMILRSGSRVQVLQPSGLKLVRERCKGGSPRVGKAERITFGVKGGGITTLRLSLLGGPFAPGRTPEPEGSEIEIKMKLVSTASEARIDATPGDDLIRGGSLGGPMGLNLNPAAEPTQPDADVRITGVTAPVVDFYLGPGSDTLTLDGGPEFAGPLLAGYVLAFLGDGNDLYRGSAGPDLVLAEAGLDTVAALAGDDAVNSQDGLAETVDCGDGQDRVQPDAGDVLIGCEELGFVGIVD
jgi:RTX calcium-binding nonapeptide repeat (4 copies)